MRQLLHFSCLLISFFVLVNTATAATIKGVVTDNKTGEPLVGVPVGLEKTSLGAVTGLDGSFAITNVPAGTYEIIVKLNSYEKWQQQVTVQQDEVLKRNVALSGSSTMLHEVTIRQHFKNGSDEQSRNKEKNADEMLNAMSAHTIELLPDITVANVLQRVSGVTVQRDATGEGRYAVIRGMDKRYNTTLVNGLKIPSPDNKARYIPMDIFPAEIIDRLEVVKALTPNMEGDAIGGVMNLVMKDAPDHLTLSASAATGYNQTLFDRSYTAFTKDKAQSEDPARKYGTGYSATPADFSRSSLVFRNIHAKPNDLFSLTIGNRFLHNKLGIMLAGSYQNTFKGSDYIFFKPSAQADINNTAQFTDLEIRQYNKQQTRIGTHAHADYHFSDKHILTLNAMYLQLDELESRHIVDTTININRTGAGTGPVDITWRSAFRRQTISGVSLQGKHALLPNLSADWTLAYNIATRNAPNTAQLHTSVNITNQTEQINSVKYSWEKTKDHDQQGFLNLTWLPTIGGKDLEIKAGGMYRHKYRDNYYNEYELKGVGSAYYHSIETDSLKLSSNPQGILPYNDLTYNVTENISAAYLQGKIMLMEKLQLLAGVRVEHTYQHYEIARDPNNFVGQNGTFDYTDVLPGLHLKYTLNGKSNLRLSYFKSISRPAYYEIVPYQNTLNEDFTEVGNYNLKHAQANNIDARYEWFSHGNDQVLAGAFYKQITNPIEYSLDPVQGSPSALVISPNNPSGTAYNYGIEIQATKFFHSFGVSANYTYTHSQISGTVIDYHRDASGNLVKDPVNETRSLQGQAAHMGNLSLIYKGKKSGFDAQLALAYTGPMIAFLSNFKGLNYWQKGIAMLDFSTEKKITKRVSIYAKVNNILNTPTIYELREDKDPFVNPKYTYQLPYQDLPHSVLVEKALYGRNYLVGLRFKLD